MTHNLIINYWEEKGGEIWFFIHMKIKLRSPHYVW